MSLPSRERGLKFVLIFSGFVQLESLPSRERGLKSIIPAPDTSAVTVAPLAGAWIEI